MVITEQEITDAENRMTAARAAAHAISAAYNPDTARVVIALNTGIEIMVPAAQLQGLTDATAEELADIEITPSGLGLHWPALDADIYIPTLLSGIFGSERWMAQHLGHNGGRATSAAKAAAARKNGRKGGRPRT